MKIDEPVGLPRDRSPPFPIECIPLLSLPLFSLSFASLFLLSLSVSLKRLL